jgi:hypothetical protein
VTFCIGRPSILYLVNDIFLELSSSKHLAYALIYRHDTP